LPKYSQAALFYLRNERKVQRTTIYKAKMAFIGCFVVSNSYRLSGIYVILMNCFGTKKARSLGVMLMEKRDATFTVEMLSQKNRCK
jgi:hypothetical protein